jgi:hypothetical protein
MRHFAFVIAALVGALVFAGSASAAGKKTASPFAAQVIELHEIKLLLERADHDYKGHRAAAVKQLTEAIHALEAGHKHHEGKAVKGGREPQKLSDVQLLESIKALNVVLAQLSTATGAPATKGAVHVTNAIKDLEIALKIK